MHIKFALTKLDNELSKEDVLKKIFQIFNYSLNLKEINFVFDKRLNQITVYKKDSKKYIICLLSCFLIENIFYFDWLIEKPSYIFETNAHYKVEYFFNKIFRLAIKDSDSLIAVSEQIDGYDIVVRVLAQQKEEQQKWLLQILNSLEIVNRSGDSFVQGQGEFL